MRISLLEILLVDISLKKLKAGIERHGTVLDHGQP
jgi:hypothetical protein